MSALIRLAEAAGGFGVVVFKGDPTAGQIIIQTLEKGQFSGLYEPLLGSSNTYHWQKTGPQVHDKLDEISTYLERRRARDPDLWVIELDVPIVSRFIVESVSSA